MVRISTTSRRLTTAALAVLLTVVAAASASADFFFSKTDGDGFTTVKVYDDDGNWKGSHYYGPEMEYFGSKYPDSDPNPEGDGGGGALGPDAIDALLALLKKLGGGYETDLVNNPVVLGLIEQGKYPGADIDPWDALAYDELGGYGGGGGFDPNTPLGEQIGRLKSQGAGDDDDDDGGDKPKSPPENPEPEVIDPPPYDVDVLDLTGFSLSATESAEIGWLMTFMR